MGSSRTVVNMLLQHFTCSTFCQVPPSPLPEGKETGVTSPAFRGQMTAPTIFLTSLCRSRPGLQLCLTLPVKTQCCVVCIGEICDGDDDSLVSNQRHPVALPGRDVKLAEYRFKRTLMAVP